VPKFPDPPHPDALRKVSPDTKIIPAGTNIWRIYFKGGDYPTKWNTFRAFGPVDGRFDHHLIPKRTQSRKILYGSARGLTCFAEVFQKSRVIDRVLREPWLTAFTLSRDLVLLDLTDNWPTRAGASTAINSGSRKRAQRWSQAIYAAYPSIDGLWYCSSMDGHRPALALYERATSGLPRTPLFHRALSDPALETMIENAAREFNYIVRPDDTA